MHIWGILTYGWNVKAYESRAMFKARPGGGWEAEHQHWGIPWVCFHSPVPLWWTELN